MIDTVVEVFSLEQIQILATKKNVQIWLDPVYAKWTDKQTNEWNGMKKKTEFHFAIPIPIPTSTLFSEFWLLFFGFFSFHYFFVSIIIIAYENNLMLLSVFGWLKELRHQVIQFRSISTPLSFSPSIHPFYQKKVEK